MIELKHFVAYLSVRTYCTSAIISGYSLLRIDDDTKIIDDRNNYTAKWLN